MGRAQPEGLGVNLGICAAAVYLKRAPTASSEQENISVRPSERESNLKGKLAQSEGEPRNNSLKSKHQHPYLLWPRAMREKALEFYWKLHPQPTSCRPRLKSYRVRTGMRVPSARPPCTEGIAFNFHRCSGLTHAWVILYQNLFFFLFPQSCFTSWACLILPMEETFNGLVTDRATCKNVFLLY